MSLKIKSQTGSKNKQTGSRNKQTGSSLPACRQTGLVLLYQDKRTIKPFRLEDKEV